MTDRDYIAERINAGAHLIPGHMVGAVRRYILDGIPPGSFLTAVICNDLFGAVACADEENLVALASWVRFFYNYAPTGCYGSRENMANWIRSIP